MSRDADIARIAAMLCTLAIGEPHETTSEAIDRYHGKDAAALYDAGLRPSVEPAGLDAAELNRAALLEVDMAQLEIGRWEDGPRYAGQLMVEKMGVLMRLDQARNAIAALLPTQASDSPEKP